MAWLDHYVGHLMGDDSLEPEGVSGILGEISQGDFGGDSICLHYQKGKDIANNFKQKTKISHYTFVRFLGFLKAKSKQKR